MTSFLRRHFQTSVGLGSAEQITFHVSITRLIVKMWSLLRVGNISGCREGGEAISLVSSLISSSISPVNFFTSDWTFSSEAAAFKGVWFLWGWMGYECWSAEEQFHLQAEILFAFTLLNGG